MSSTVTRTAAPAEPVLAIVLKLQPDFERLRPIVKKYISWKDHLSVMIQNWWLDARACSMRGRSEAEALSLIQERVDHLRAYVLVDCLTRSPLRTPILVQGWTWDKDSLAKYKLYFTLFDGKPLSPEAPHEFASEVIVWTESLPDPIAERPSRALVQSNDASPLAQVGRIVTYSQLERKAVQLRREQQENRSLQRLERSFAQMKLALQEQGAQLMQRLGEENEHHEAELKRGINDLKERQEERVQVLEERIVATEKRSEETRTIDRKTIGIISEEARELKKDLKDTSARLTAEEKKNVELSGTVANLSAALQAAHARMGHLENEINNKDSCAIS